MRFPSVSGFCEAFDVVDIAVKEGFQVVIASLNKNGDRLCLVLRLLLHAHYEQHGIQVFEAFDTCVSSKVFKGWVDSLGILL